MSKTSNGSPYREKAIVPRDRKFKPGPTEIEIQRGPERMDMFEVLVFVSFASFFFCGGIAICLWAAPWAFAAACALASACVCRVGFVRTRDMLREHAAGTRQEDNDGD